MRVNKWDEFPLLGFPRMCDVLKQGEQGDVKIVHYTVNEDQIRLFNLQCLFGGNGIGVMEPGKWTKMIVGNKIMMSDTLMERRTNRGVLRQGNGQILLGGLGIGMIIHGLMAKPEVKHIHVIELSQDVIDLVSPSLKKYRSKISIEKADMMEWRTKEKWDVIYFDIWPDSSQDNLPDAAVLGKRFGRRLNRENPNCWMGGWRIEELRSQRDSENRSGRWW